MNMKVEVNEATMTYAVEQAVNDYSNPVWEQWAQAVGFVNQRAKVRDRRLLEYQDPPDPFPLSDFPGSEEQQRLQSENQHATNRVWVPIKISRTLDLFLEMRSGIQAHQISLKKQEPGNHHDLLALLGKMLFGEWENLNSLNLPSFQLTQEQAGWKPTPFERGEV